MNTFKMVKVFLTSIDSGSFTRAGEIRGIHRGSICIGSYVSTSSTWLPQVIGYYRMLDLESYRSLGIGIRSIKEAGPLARSVIEYIKENIR